MLVEAVAKARKPSGYITLGTALEIVAKANSGFKWEHNQYKDLHFRFDSIANAFDAEKGTYTFLHFKYIAEENQIKSKRLNVNNETEFAKAKEAIGMLRAAYRKLFSELAKKRHSIKIQIYGSSKDKTNNYYGYSDIGAAVWIKCRPSIYRTGLVDYTNSNDTQLEGILLLHKKDVIEFAKKLKKVREAKESAKDLEIDENGAEILKDYVKRLSQYAKEKKLIAKEETNTLYSKGKERVRVLITIEQCKEFVTQLARAHRWGMSDTSFNQFLHNKTTKESSFINSCGIALGGRPPKIAGVPSSHSVIEELKAKILKEIADKKH